MVSCYGIKRFRNKREKSLKMMSSSKNSRKQKQEMEGKKPPTPPSWIKRGSFRTTRMRLRVRAEAEYLPTRQTPKRTCSCSET